MGQNEIILGLAILIGLIINSFFCITLVNTLNQVKSENRELPSWIIWLLLIPLLSLGVMFYVVYRLSSSIENELHDRNFEVTERPGYAQGMGFACIGIIVNLPMPAFLVGILAIVGLVLFIQYWVKMNWYKKILRDDVSHNEE
ncbi:MAG: hypothetical protein K0S09_1800 [Sphingobacteriaceae bacterium]|jgi:cell division protein FtsW (lipid II flippase)|nr:hypothetical protein [Sphingobacteriaceae bacterium]